MKTFFGLIALIALLGSCDTYSEEDKAGFDKKIVAYLSKKDAKCIKSPSGLHYEIIEPGEGALIKYKDKVSFTYKGTLLNGKMFADQSEPVTFEVSQLIGCWKEIMLNLKPGGKAFLVAPPQLGYGDHPLPDIPKNSILIFEMEVVDVN